VNTSVSTLVELALVRADLNDLINDAHAPSNGVTDWRQVAQHLIASMAGTASSLIKANMPKVVVAKMRHDVHCVWDCNEEPVWVACCPCCGWNDFFSSHESAMGLAYWHARGYHTISTVEKGH
jgi:hypothetical protein